MTVKRMDTVGIVVEDIDAAIEFFVEVAMMRAPDGHSRLELSRFDALRGGRGASPPGAPRGSAPRGEAARHGEAHFSSPDGALS